MPTYQSKCLACFRTYEYVASISECYNTPRCPICNTPTCKEIRTAPTGFVMGKFEPFVSPVDGSVIRTQKDLKAHNERNGVTNIHEGYSEEAILSGQAGQKSSIEKAIEEKRQQKELAEDIATSIKKVEAGYKPQLETLEDD